MKIPAIFTSLVLVNLVIGCVVLTGCAGKRRSSNARSQYLFDVDRPEGNGVYGSSELVAKIRHFNIATPFETRNLVYRTSEVDYDIDFYNEYITSPDTLITEIFRKWLTQSPVFSNVVDVNSRIDTDFYLEANIMALYGDFRQPESPKTVVEIQVYLVDERPRYSSIRFERIYKHTETIDDNSVSELIRGQSRCLEQILQICEKDLFEAMSDLEAEPGI